MQLRLTAALFASVANEDMLKQYNNPNHSSSKHHSLIVALP